MILLILIGLFTVVATLAIVFNPKAALDGSSAFEGVPMNDELTFQTNGNLVDFTNPNAFAMNELLYDLV